MHWTPAELDSAPDDMVIDLLEKWRAEAAAKRIRSKSGGSK